MTKPIFPADSHITESPDTYTSRIGKHYKDQAPHMVRHDRMRDLFVINGMDVPVPMGLVAAAGKPPEEITIAGLNFEDLHPRSWAPNQRPPTRTGTASQQKSFTQPSASCSAIIQISVSRKRASMRTTSGSKTTATNTPADSLAADTTGSKSGR
jgi:hypothetical protein